MEQSQSSNQIFRSKHQVSATIYGSIASRTNFFPIDEKSMQKNPRLRPVLLKEQARPICASRTGQGRFLVERRGFAKARDNEKSQNAYRN